MTLAEGWLIPGFTPAGFAYRSRLIKTDLTVIEEILTPPPGVQSVAFNGQLWVAASLDNSTDGPFAALASSSDGNSWTPQASPFDRAYAVRWTGDRFIAVGVSDSNGTLIATSTDGSDWTAATSPNDGITVTTEWEGDVRSVYTFIDGIGDTWVVGGLPIRVHAASDLLHGQTNATAYTTDGGLTWTACTLPTISVNDGLGDLTVGVCQVAYGPTGWLGISGTYGGDLLFRSNDAATWTLIGTPNTYLCDHRGYDDPVIINEHIFGFGEVRALADDWVLSVGLTSDTEGLFDRSAFLVSPDASSWTTQEGPAPLQMHTSNGVLFSCSESGYSGGGGDGVDIAQTVLDWTPLTGGFFGIGNGGPAIDYGKFGLPPQRQFPRDDGLAASTRRSWPPNVSKQHGLRRGTINTYQ